MMERELMREDTKKIRKGGRGESDHLTHDIASGFFPIIKALSLSHPHTRAVQQLQDDLILKQFNTNTIRHLLWSCSILLVSTSKPTFPNP